MKKFIIAPTASRDLNKIADYFLTVNVTAGEKLFQLFGSDLDVVVKAQCFVSWAL
jgi:toxin ParE1/3/4